MLCRNGLAPVCSLGSFRRFPRASARSSGLAPPPIPAPFGPRNASCRLMSHPLHSLPPTIVPTCFPLRSSSPLRRRMAQTPSRCCRKTRNSHSFMRNPKSQWPNPKQSPNPKRQGVAARRLVSAVWRLRICVCLVLGAWRFGFRDCPRVTTIPGHPAKSLSESPASCGTAAPGCALSVPCTPEGGRAT